jgi:hypothetical protein
VSDRYQLRDLLFGLFEARPGPKAVGASHVCACAGIKTYLHRCCAKESRLNRLLIVLYVTLSKLAARSPPVTSHGSLHGCSLFCPSIIEQQDLWFCWALSELLLPQYWNAKCVELNVGARQHIQTKQTPWPLVRKQTIPTERPPLVDEI